MSQPSYANEIHPDGAGPGMAELGHNEWLARKNSEVLQALAGQATQHRRRTDQVDHMTVPGYESLAQVFRDAYAQAAVGKGRERHADSKPFDQQPMQDLIRLHGVGFATGQASKKAQESQRMAPDAAVRELRGAMVYLAGAVIALQRKAVASGAGMVGWNHSAMDQQRAAKDTA